MQLKDRWELAKWCTEFLIEDSEKWEKEIEEKEKEIKRERLDWEKKNRFEKIAFLRAKKNMECEPTDKSRLSSHDESEKVWKSKRPVLVQDSTEIVQSIPSTDIPVQSDILDRLIVHPSPEVSTDLQPGGAILCQANTTGVVDFNRVNNTSKDENFETKDGFIHTTLVHKVAEVATLPKKLILKPPKAHEKPRVRKPRIIKPGIPTNQPGIDNFVKKMQPKTPPNIIPNSTQCKAPNARAGIKKVKNENTAASTTVGSASQPGCIVARPGPLIPTNLVNTVESQTASSLDLPSQPILAPTVISDIFE